MLIERGKTEGWLHFNADLVRTWAIANGINFNNAVPSTIPGRGLGLVASSDLISTIKGELCLVLEVPANLILSKEAVKQHASFDRDFRELLDSLRDFGQTPRGAILSFLLFQASISCPDLTKPLGVHGAFTDYIKTLPCELLPTFWRTEELNLLVGTTLAPAMSSKLASLRKEYDLLCTSAESTRWYQAVQPYLDFDDWLHVDAMFRSRALDFYGSCMIPGLDLASHAAGEETNAFYDRLDGTYSLRLMEGKSLSQGQEVTITYGDEKGACEMLFSYGFIDERMETAETLYLGLSIPEDDVSRVAKLKIAGCAPGFRLIEVAERAEPADNDSSIHDSEGAEHESEHFTLSDAISWTGDFVWLMCVGREDGFVADLARTTDGTEEMQANFNGQELIDGARGLCQLLAKSELWPVYRLRAVVILQQRVFDQLQVLYSGQEQLEATPHGDTTEVRITPYNCAMKLRRLEFGLLERAYEDLENQKLELAATSVVRQYLEQINNHAELVDEPEESFA